MTGASADLGPVRVLDEADLPACLDLAADRDWAREDVKWRLALAAGSGFGVDDPGGGLAGTVALTRYEPGLAVIGLLLVASRHGRRGLGRRLMEHALHLAAGRVVYLYATPEGRPLYEALGFRVLDHVTRHIGTFTPGPGGDSALGVSTVGGGPLGGSAPGEDSPGSGDPRPGVLGGGLAVRPPVPADQAGVLDLDRAVFGADRAALLGALAQQPARVIVAAGHRGIAGHASAWRNLGTLAIGPVVARDDATAMCLVQALAGAADGPARVDLPARFAGVSGWLAERGLPPGAVDPLMSYQGRPLPGLRTHLYGLLMQGMG